MTTDSVLHAALDYYELGWAVIPIPAGSKAAKLRWGPYRETPADREQIEQWFRTGRSNIAVILGGTSGGLNCRDFDKADGYPAWAGAHPDLAAVLPTVRTHGGHHVYFLGDAKGFQYLGDGDGELRGSNCYCILPPSIHPEGTPYRWLIPPTKDNLLALDPYAVGLAECRLQKSETVTEKTETPERPESTERTEGDRKSVVWDESLELIVRKTLPREPGTRHRRLFDLIRHLHSSPQYSSRRPEDLRSILEEWHRRALPFIRTKPFSETWIDFLKCWPKVRFKIGADPMTKTYERATRGKLPAVALRLYPDHRELQRLAALCRELQREAGDAPFFLSCRTAGELLGVSHTEANRWLFLLAHDHVIVEVAKGGTSENPRRATRYRYVGGAS